MFNVEGMGCVIRECSEEVRLGMIRLLSAWSRVPGRPSRSPVRGRTNEACVLSEGAIASICSCRFRGYWRIKGGSGAALMLDRYIRVPVGGSTGQQKSELRSRDVLDIGKEGSGHVVNPVLGEDIRVSTGRKASPATAGQWGEMNWFEYKRLSSSMLLVRLTRFRPRWW